MGGKESNDIEKFRSWGGHLFLLSLFALVNVSCQNG
jgi:hypothetical protein